MHQKEGPADAANVVPGHESDDCLGRPVRIYLARAAERNQAIRRRPTSRHFHVHSTPDLRHQRGSGEA